jgi:hypothetical protein
MVSWTAGDDVPFVGLDLAAAGGTAAQHLSLGYPEFGTSSRRQPQWRAPNDRYRSTIRRRLQ